MTRPTIAGLAWQSLANLSACLIGGALAFGLGSIVAWRLAPDNTWLWAVTTTAFFQSVAAATWLEVKLWQIRPADHDVLDLYALAIRTKAARMKSTSEERQSYIRRWVTIRGLSSVKLLNPDPAAEPTYVEVLPDGNLSPKSRPVTTRPIISRV